MVTKLVNQPLGMGHGAGSLRDNLFVGGSEQKLWIPIALAAASVASSLIGGAKSAAAAKEAEEKQRAQEAKEEAWYRRRYNENYLDTAAGQNLVRRAKEYARENWKRAAGAQAVGGGTEASVAMAKEAGNKMVGDTIANIAATDQQRKDNIDNQHQQNQSKFAQMDVNRELQRSQNISNAAQGMSNAMMSAASAVAGAQAQNKPSLAGGNNSGKVVEKPVTPTTTKVVSPKIAGQDGVTADDLAEKWELYGG